MFCRKESYHDSSAVSRCISLRISPASCSKCPDRRLGGLDLFRVKVGCSPEMVAVRLRGQTIPTPYYVAVVSSCTTFSIVSSCLQQSVLWCAVCVRFVTQVAVVFCSLRRTVRRNSWNANRWGVVCVAGKRNVINLLDGAGVKRLRFMSQPERPEENHNLNWQQIHRTVFQPGTSQIQITSLLLERPTRALRFNSRLGCWKLYHAQNVFSLKPNFVCKWYWNIDSFPPFTERRHGILGVSSEIRTLASRIQIDLYLWSCCGRYFLCI
jgi:hypothetical protein